MYRFLRLSIIFFLWTHVSVSAQSKLSKYAIDASVFYGNTLEHNSEIAHLLTEHPTGFLLSWSKTLNPKEYWSYKNNYPKLGLSFSYHQSHVEALGDNYALYGHIHWYFASRLLQLKLAQGIAYSDNPYHADKNFRNNAYGSSLLAATRLELNFIKKQILEGFGIQAGLGIVHYSNGAIKKPNTSANTMYAHVGLRYSWDEVPIPSTIDYVWLAAEHEKSIYYEATLRGGVNQSGIGEKTREFFVLGGAIGKRWSYRSGWHAGVELFYSPFLKDHIRFRSIAFPDGDFDGTEDFKRLGVYTGYDMHISDALSLFADLGFYAYWPVRYEKQVYNRAGIKYRFNHSAWFAMLGVKAHFSKAEAMEFGIGYRF